MRLCRCDECRNTAETSHYDDPCDWLVVSQGAEDDLHFCSMNCLWTWAGIQLAAHETK